MSKVEVAGEWDKVIDRRTREIKEGKVTCRPIKEVVREIQNKLNARRKRSQRK